MNPYRLVEEVGDLTFAVADYPTEAEAFLAAADLCAASDEERELFVDGPGITRPKPAGVRSRQQH